MNRYIEKDNQKWLSFCVDDAEILELASRVQKSNVLHNASAHCLLLRNIIDRKQIRHLRTQAGRTGRKIECDPAGTIKLGAGYQ